MDASTIALEDAKIAFIGGIVVAVIALIGSIVGPIIASKESAKTRRLDAYKIVYHELFCVVRDAMELVTQAHLHAISCKRYGTSSRVVNRNGQATEEGILTTEYVRKELRCTKDLILNRRWVIGDNAFHAFTTVIDHAVELLNTPTLDKDTHEETKLRNSYEHLTRIL